MSNFKARFFVETSKEAWQVYRTVFENEVKNTVEPYYSFDEQYQSLFTPFDHLESCISNLARISQGALSLVNALFVDPFKAIPQVLMGICIEAAGLIVNALSAVISCISLLTRSIATLFNFGYESSCDYRNEQNFGFDFNADINRMRR